MGGPRSDERLIEVLGASATRYKNGISEALTELQPHQCSACFKAYRILDRAQHPVLIMFPEPREPDPLPPFEMPTLDHPLSVFEVSLLFTVSEETVGRWAATGRVPSYLNEQGHRRFDPAVIDKLLD